MLKLELNRRLVSLQIFILLCCVSFYSKINCEHVNSIENHLESEETGESPYYEDSSGQQQPTAAGGSSNGQPAQTQPPPGSGKFSPPPLTLLTIATGLTQEPLARFSRTADYNGFREGLDFQVIELQHKTKSTDWPLLSDSKKLTILRKAIKILSKDSEDQIILFVDSETSLILGSPTQIMTAFKTTGAKILLSSSKEDTCALLGNNNTTKDSPEEDPISSIINFDGFIGYAKELHTLLNTQPASSSANNTFKSLINSAYYLNESLRTELGLQLDSNNIIFYTIKSTDYQSKDVKLHLNLDGNIIRPKLLIKSTGVDSKSRPLLIVQANICQYRAYMTNSILNYYGNYLTPTLPQDKLKLRSADKSIWPTITMGIFIEKPTPFMEEFFNEIYNLNYNKSRIHLFIYNKFKYNVKDVDLFLNQYSSLYASVKLIRSRERVKEWAARNIGIEYALEVNTDYYFSLDSTAHLENKNTLRMLVEANKLIVAPLLCYITTSTADLHTIAKNFCNFWGTVNSDGLYEKSIDYKDIATSEHFGIWNVPYISGAYLIHKSILQSPETRPNFIHGLDDPDVSFCTNNRNRGIFMFIVNDFDAGHLVNNDFFESNHLHNELYQIFDNRFDWEKRYLHSNYYDVLPPEYGGKSKKPAEPCLDVFWFPIVTERFAKEMIGEMEGYGKWADGSVEARGDPYPTVDIQMDEIGYMSTWHEFMRLYIKPLQELVFNGYDTYPPKTEQAFVVKYSAKDQRELKPHFDQSTYTVNIALNSPHIDFEGGGCRFTRFNCSVVDTKLGWMFLHPGHFTHKHEGLRISKGLRYILVAFIDPFVSP